MGFFGKGAVVMGFDTACSLESMPVRHRIGREPLMVPQDLDELRLQLSGLLWGCAMLQFIGNVSERSFWGLLLKKSSILEPGAGAGFVCGAPFGFFRRKMSWDFSEVKSR